MPAFGTNVAGRLARPEALDSLPDPADSDGAVRELLHSRQAGNSVPDFDQPVAGPIGSQLSKLLFAGELLSFLNSDFGLRGVSGDVVFRVDGENRHKFLLFRTIGGHDINHSG